MKKLLPCAVLCLFSSFASADGFSLNHGSALQSLGLSETAPTQTLSNISVSNINFSGKRGRTIGLDPLMDAAPILKLSPTIMTELAELQAAGWKIQYVAPGAGTNTNVMTCRIQIESDTAGQPNELAARLSHEVEHAISFREYAAMTLSLAVARSNYCEEYIQWQNHGGLELDGALAQLPRSEYVQKFVQWEEQGEGAAILNNIIVKQEILARGGPTIPVGAGDPEKSEAIGDSPQLSRDEKVDEIGKINGRAWPSGTPEGTTYDDYYGKYGVQRWDCYHQRESNLTHCPASGPIF